MKTKDGRMFIVFLFNYIHNTKLVTLNYFLWGPSVVMVTGSDTFYHNILKRVGQMVGLAGHRESEQKHSIELKTRPEPNFRLSWLRLNRIRLLKSLEIRRTISKSWIQSTIGRKPLDNTNLQNQKERLLWAAVFSPKLTTMSSSNLTTATGWNPQNW